MATFTTFDQNGKKEDISDVISNISPTKTPYITSIKSKKIKNTLHQWQEDSLAAVADIAAVEGSDATFATIVPTVSRTNSTQIIRDAVQISDGADVMDTYGRAKETAYQIAKKGEELKRSLEYTLIGVDRPGSLGNASTAGKMTNVWGMIDSSVTVTVDSDTGTAGNQAGVITETHLLSALQKCYTEGAEPSIVMVKPKDAEVIAGFAGTAARMRDVGATGTTLTNRVDIYDSPYGKVAVTPNRFIKSSEALVYDPANWSLCVYRPWQTTPLAKTGDSSKTMLLWEGSLEHRNFKASGRITNLL